MEKFKSLQLTVKFTDGEVLISDRQDYETLLRSVGLPETFRAELRLSEYLERLTAIKSLTGFFITVGGKQVSIHPDSIKYLVIDLEK